MELENLTWRGQFLVFLVVGAIGFIIFYSVHYSPTQQSIKRMDEEIELLDTEIAKGRQQQRKITKLQEQLKSHQKKLDELKKILPERNEISDIIKQVYAEIANYRMEDDKYNPKNENVKRDIIEAPIEITVRGRYHNLGGFFDQISRIQKLFTINNLAIRSEDNRGVGDTVKADFTAVTYIYREQVQAKK